MNKWAAGGCLWLVSVALQAATLLHVKAGDVHVLDVGQPVLVLDELVLDDGASLQVPATATPVRIEARRAVIGEGVKIVATGKAGAAGAAGTTLEQQAEKCSDGGAGGHGGHGAVGADGVTLDLTLQIAKLGSLQIDTQGGQGGEGGDGGKGQDAGEFDTCSAPAGGDGGRGGDGGDGGNGGAVRIYYSLLSESGLNDNLAERIKVNAKGGEGGTGGDGGKGGEGGPGKFVSMKTLSGNKKWVAGGKAGAKGVTGANGRDGLKAQVSIQPDLRSRMDDLARQQEAQVQAINAQLAAQLAEDKAAAQQQGSDMGARIDKLEQTLGAVLKRLDQLEAAATKAKPVAAPAAAPAPAP